MDVTYFIARAVNKKVFRTKTASSINHSENTLSKTAPAGKRRVDTKKSQHKNYSYALLIYLHKTGKRTYSHCEAHQEMVIAVEGKYALPAHLRNPP